MDIDEIENDREIKLEDDEVAIKLSGISKSLDPVFFYDAFVTEGAVLGYKTSVGTTSTAMYD